jgi:competence protein ComEA
VRTVIALLALLAIARADDWQTIRGCRLIENESNDGDSFHVKADGEERIFRLYFVDTPEAESGGYVEARVGEQAKELGLTEEESVEMGKKATAFTRAVLSRPFKVTTRGQNALGASQTKREYAFVKTADGEDLGEMLVSRGLARSFGQTASGPEGSASSLRAKYDRLEARARREGVGAWGGEAGARTIELPSNQQKRGSSEPNRSPSATRLVPPPAASTANDEEINADIVSAAIGSAMASISSAPNAQAATESVALPRTPSRANALKPSNGKVNINSATQDELEALPEIGPKTAQAIIAGRPYNNAADVDRVEGIGPQTLEAILPQITE